MSETRFHNIWKHILRRCNNPNAIEYKNYGGRGIKYLWNSFNEFKNDMYKSYLTHLKKYGKKNTTIDRINNDRHYCKENCRWVTRRQQMRNNRRNVLITYKGQTKCLVEWAEKLGVTRISLANRIQQYGWSVKKTLETPVRYRRPNRK